MSIKMYAEADVPSVSDQEIALIDAELKAQGYSIKKALDRGTVFHYQENGFTVTEHSPGEWYIGTCLGEQLRSASDPPPVDAKLRREMNTGIDRIEIKAENRWKTSGLSGDEWRYGVRVDLYRKGKVVFSRYQNNSWFAELKPNFVAIAEEFKMMKTIDLSDQAEFDRLEPLCDHFSCSEPGEMYRMLKRGKDSEGNYLPPDGRVHVKRFCSAHADRGNCGIIDSKRNFVRHDPPQRKRDASPTRKIDPKLAQH